MADKALQAIGNVAADCLSYRWFRDTFRANHDLKDSLRAGHAVPASVEQLDQYLHTYGPMIESQWHNIGPHLDAIAPPELLIDYGCGQGLGGLLANDLTEGELLGRVRRALLIEPSSVALARAAAIYRRLVPGAVIAAIAKRFDAIQKGDLPPVPSGTTLHLFSNSLDVPGSDPHKLLAKTLRPGRHVILSLSHDRSFNGGTPRIEAVRAAVGKRAGRIVHKSTLHRFTCSNQSRSKGLAWICELEVGDG